MRTNKILAMSALLISMEDPNSDMPETTRTIVHINNEMALVAGKGVFARSDSAKEKWLARLDTIEGKLNALLEAKDEKDLTVAEVDDLVDTKENIEDIRGLLKIE